MGGWRGQDNKINEMLLAGPFEKIEIFEVVNYQVEDYISVAHSYERWSNRSYLQTLKLTNQRKKTKQPIHHQKTKNQKQ